VLPKKNPTANSRGLSIALTQTPPCIIRPMNVRLLAITTVLLLVISGCGQSNNPERDKDCPGCDLTGVQLEGASLSGADLFGQFHRPYGRQRSSGLHLAAQYPGDVLHGYESGAAFNLEVQDLDDVGVVQTGG